jgi:organic radical activating enzyme
MKQHPISEIFMSIEGEGPHSGVPTAYIRYAGCNMKCPGFNNPEQERTDDGYAPLPFEISEIKSLEDINEITVGCDSQYAVNQKFKHIWHHWTTDELVQNLTDMVPHKQWINPRSNRPVTLSITGGEPTLKQRLIPELLNHELMKDINHIIIETNCSLNLKPRFIDALNEWVERTNGLITWANSPKVKASGEAREDAIRPQVALQQLQVNNCEQYFKFVCDDDESAFEEVADVMKEYHEAGVPETSDTLIMPMCCTEAQQQKIMLGVALKCIDYGYIYAHRVHNTVFENVIGK